LLANSPIAKSLVLGLAFSATQVQGAKQSEFIKRKQERLNIGNVVLYLRERLAKDLWGFSHLRRPAGNDYCGRNGQSSN
jgi:hypothetical protein